MATNFLELATTLKYLGAKWLPEKIINFTPCSYKGRENNCQVSKLETWGSVGWASGCHTEGHEFNSGLTITQGLKNWGETAAFAITPVCG